MIGRLLKQFERSVSAWFRPPGQPPLGKLYKGNHSAFGRTFSLIQLTPGRRPYLLYLPKQHNPATKLPMVVMLHGCKQDAETFAAATRMNGLADRDKFIVLYPEQRRLANPHRCWNWFSRSAQDGSGEAAILFDMIRSLASEHNVDTARIYIAGLSAGAAMANNLAMSHAELFAACALHSGLMYGAAASTGEALQAMRTGSRRDPVEAGRRAFANLRGKAQAIPALVIHGEKDETVDPVNADQIVSQFEVLNTLLAEETYGQAAKLIVRSSTNRSLGGYQYGTTDYLRDEQLLGRKVMVSALGHAWSGGVADYPYNDPLGPDASELICDFFTEFGLRRASPKSAAVVSA